MRSWVQQLILIGLITYHGSLRQFSQKTCITLWCWSRNL